MRPKVIQEVASEQFAGAAAFGDDLAIFVVNDQGEPSLSLIRRSPDGTMTEMPPLPSQGAYRVASAGDTVLVGGVACGVEIACTEGQPVVFQLRDGAAKWEQVYSGPETVDSEIEISATVGPTRFALFSIGQTGVLVGEDGLISDDTPRPQGEAFSELNYTYFCHLADRAVMIPAKLEPGPGSEEGNADTQAGVQMTKATGSVWELRFDAYADGWVKVAKTPGDITNIGGHTECAGSQMVIHNDEVKWTYDSDTRRWITGPSTYRELTGSQVFGPSQPGEIAVSPSGEKVYAISQGRVVERTREGSWAATDVMANEIYATATNGLAVTPSAGHPITFVELPK